MPTDSAARSTALLSCGIIRALAWSIAMALPLFNRAEAAAANVNLKNFKPNPTEYYTHNAGEWELPGKDALVLGFTQEPASLYTLVESAAVATTAAQLISQLAVTSLDYDYQPVGFTKLPSLGDGATNADVEVKAGDMVLTTTGEAVALAKDWLLSTSDADDCLSRQ